MDFLEELVDVVKKNEEFIITTHANPDGDAVGSLLGLGLALLNFGKVVSMVLPGPVPYIYRFMPGSKFIQTPLNIPDQTFTTGIVLDCTDLCRAGNELAEIFEKTGCLINIDHHISNQRFGDLNIVDTGAAATGEIVFDLLVGTGVAITPDIATNLYVALITDTGSFQHQNTTARCHRTAAHLLDHGADHILVHNHLYEQRSLSSLRLLQLGLKTLSLNKQGQIAWMKISQSALSSSGCNMDDCDGIVDYAKSLRGVEVGILFKEIKPGEIKVSFRSKNYLDVNQLAACFGGGGHERAAGCTIKGNLKDVEAIVVQSTEDLLAKK